MPGPPDTLPTQKLFTYIISFDPPHSRVILEFVVAPCVTARQRQRESLREWKCIFKNTQEHPGKERGSQGPRLSIPGCEAGFASYQESFPHSAQHPPSFSFSNSHWVTGCHSAWSQPYWAEFSQVTSEVSVTRLLILIHLLYFSIAFSFQAGTVSQAFCCFFLALGILSGQKAEAA